MERGAEEREERENNLPKVCDLFVSKVGFKEKLQDVFFCWEPLPWSILSEWPLHVNKYAHTLMFPEIYFYNFIL